MTQAEQEALNLVYSATISVDEWVKRIRQGYPPGTPYKVTATRYYQALDTLRKAGGGVPGPVPPPAPSIASLVQNVVFCAQSPESALAAPAKFKVALTADPAYAAWNTPELVARFRAQGRKVAAWGVQTQIGANATHNFKLRLGLDYIIWQGETVEEFDTAIAAGATAMVGNPNAWTPAQCADAILRIAGGKLAVTGECYTNLGGPWPNAYGASGVPVASLTIGVYDGSGETQGGWDPSVAAYKQNTPAGVWESISVYHASAVHPDEWSLLA